MGRIVTISGPRGVGKTTVIDSLRDDHGIASLAPYTTRQRREHEVEGRDYQFIDREAFEHTMVNSPMFDTLEVKGQYYGTPLSMIDNVLESDQTQTFNVASHTALKLRKYGSGLVHSVMLLPASWEDIREQMRASGVSESDIENRIQNEPTDLKLLPAFDRLIINRRDDLPGTVQETLQFIRSL